MVWITAVCLVLAGVLLASYYAYRVAFYARGDHQAELYLLPLGEEHEQHRPQIREQMDRLKAMDYEPVRIRSFDGKSLFARYYPGREGAPVHIQFHGYRSSGIRDFCVGAQVVMELGHHVLLVDQRAHGHSEGRTITFGIKERRDCQLWCRYARDRFGPDRPMVLWGVSMGAATVLMAMELALPENVRAVIADCPYSDPKAMIARVAGAMGLPAKAATGCCRIGALVYGGFRLSQATAVGAVAHAQCPILLIHGLEDRFVPWQMSQQIQKAAPEQICLERFPEAGHAMSCFQDPQRYRQVVSRFLNAHLPA